MVKEIDRYWQLNTLCFGHLLTDTGAINCQGWSLSFSLYFFFALLTCVVFNSTMAELSVKYEWIEVNPNFIPEKGVWGNK